MQNINLLFTEISKTLIKNMKEDPIGIILHETVIFLAIQPYFTPFVLTFLKIDAVTSIRRFIPPNSTTSEIFSWIEFPLQISFFLETIQLIQNFTLIILIAAVTCVLCLQILDSLNDRAP